MLDLLFPLECPGCGRRGTPACDRCSSSLLPAIAAPPPPSVDEWWAPFAYTGVVRELVARAKYRGVRAAVPWLADALATQLSAASGFTGTVDVVTWAPTTPAHRRARGFDPAQMLARAVARRLRLRSVILLTRAPGPAQTGLSATERHHGPRFRPRAAVPPSVLVVDDVATTGATLAAAAAALRAGGARRVVAATRGPYAAPRQPPGLMLRG